MQTLTAKGLTLEHERVTFECLNHIVSKVLSHTSTRANKTWRGHCTFDPLFKVFAWSMQCLLRGVAPSQRHDGSEFSRQDRQRRLPAGSLIPRAALLQARGDWEWLCQCFRFRHFQNESFCFLCDASHTGANSYYNLAADAAYRQTTITHERRDIVHTSTNQNSEPLEIVTMC